MIMFAVSLSMVVSAVAILFFLIFFFKSIHMIGQTEVGVVSKRLGKKITNDNPIAFNGEAGYQAVLLMPGLRFKLWPIFVVEKHPWPQVPAGEIGVVIAQVGLPIPIGYKSAVYKPEFGSFTNLSSFVKNGGQKGVQRPVLTPGTLAPIHPVGFLVITKKRVYGIPVAEEYSGHGKGGLKPETFGLTADDLMVTQISPVPRSQIHEHYTEEVARIRIPQTGGEIDMVGVVTVLDGPPLPSGYIAGRLGGFEDIEKMEEDYNSRVNGEENIDEAIDPKNVELTEEELYDAIETAKEARRARTQVGNNQATPEITLTDDEHKAVIEEAKKEKALRMVLQRKRQEDSEFDDELIEKVLQGKNDLHNNFQNFQDFLDNGGCIGLQHDVLMYGAYNLNPFLVKVEKVPMLVVEQGEVAVVKSYLGLPTSDTSGSEFKFGSLVRPGHQGVWQEPLRTGKFAINPRIYDTEIVSTAIITLNWATATSKAHDLDKELCSIEAKSREGFVFTIDLQVQIHVPDTTAPKVISMVGTMKNLVEEVLQAAVGNHFRDKLQSMPAIKFIEERQMVQVEAMKHITRHLGQYVVETRGVYIQDVVLPEALTSVLKDREIANQRIETYKMQKSAEDQRIQTEKSKGTANMQSELAQSEVKITIKQNEANARKAEADGEATYLTQIGKAKGAEPRAVGLANAEAYAKQVEALGQMGTTMVNVATALSKGNQPFMPHVLSTGGGNAMDGLVGVLTQMFNQKTNPIKPPVNEVAVTSEEEKKKEEDLTGIETQPESSSGGAGDADALISDEDQLGDDEHPKDDQQ